MKKQWVVIHEQIEESREMPGKVTFTVYGVFKDRDKAENFVDRNSQLAGGHECEYFHVAELLVGR